MDGLAATRRGPGQAPAGCLRPRVPDDPNRSRHGRDGQRGPGPGHHALPDAPQHHLLGRHHGRHVGARDGTLAHLINWIDTRESRFGKASSDPFQLEALGNAAADIDASLVQYFADIDRAYDIVDSGRALTFSERADIRRNQVRSSQRAVEAADYVFRLSGGSQLQKSNPAQRHWRDAQAALHHVQNLQGKMMQAWGLNRFGHPVPKAVKI